MNIFQNSKFAKFSKNRKKLQNFCEIQFLRSFLLCILPLFKKDLKDFFGPKKILFFRLKYLKVKKRILPDLAGFSVKCFKLEKKSYFRDEVSRVLNTLNRKKKSFFWIFFYDESVCRRRKLPAACLPVLLLFFIVQGHNPIQTVADRQGQAWQQSETPVTDTSQTKGHQSDRQTETILTVSRHENGRLPACLPGKNA